MDDETQGAAESPKLITSHAIGTVFTDVAESGVVQIAAMHYTRKNRTTLRIPMGKSLASGGEKLTDTQIREVIQEAAENPTDFTYELMFGSRLVYYDVVPDDDNPDTELHLKGFFAAKLTTGHLRSFRMVEHEGTEKEETLDPLRWYEVRDLVGKMSSTPSIRCHALAVFATIVKCAQTYPAVARRYGDIAERAESRVVPSPRYRGVVYDYVKKLQG